MPEKLILPNKFLAIAEDELRAGHSVKLKADGMSMYPFIRGARDTVKISPLKLSEKPRLWHAYLCRWKDKYIIHRLVGEENGEFIFSGDGNFGQTEIVTSENIIGILSRIYRNNGKEIFCDSLSWSRKGKIWHKLLPVRRYLLGVHRRLVKYGIIK